MSQAAIRLIVFDCDGTLVDSQHHIVAAMTSAFDVRGHRRPEPEAVRNVVGLSLVEAVAALLPAADPQEHEVVTETYKDAFKLLRADPAYHEPLFPGAREAIETLDQTGFVLGIATGKARRGLDATLRMHGLSAHFSTLQTADVAPGKPNPAMIERAMNETGAGRDRTLVVGDTTYDIEMAANAGVPAIGVGWGYHAADSLRAAGAASVIDRFDLLVELAHQMTGGKP